MERLEFLCRAYLNESKKPREALFGDPMRSDHARAMYAVAEANAAYEEIIRFVENSKHEEYSPTQ